MKQQNNFSFTEEELPAKQGREANFIFEPLNVKFDKNLNPILKTSSQIEDYNLARSILTDIEVMKTSTVFACGIPNNDYDLHLLMSLIIEQEEEFASEYGMQKVYSKTINDYVGIGGLIRNENNILEGGVLLKAKYIGGGIGFLIEKKLYDYMRSKQNITLIAGIWEENIPSIKLVQKNGMRFVKKINKSYNNKTIVVDLYVDFINSHSSLVPDDKYFTIVKLSKFY